MTAPTQFERRRIEAEILAETYRVLLDEMPAPQAQEIIGKATAAAARAAGRAYAQAAPGGPSLEHFCGVTDLWQAGGALEIVDSRLDPPCFRLTVTRCGYAALYINDMGLPPELAYALSCARDGAFAEGYSPHLRLTRSRTIAQGSPACEFRYEWLD